MLQPGRTDSVGQDRDLGFVDSLQSDGGVCGSWSVLTDLRLSLLPLELELAILRDLFAFFFNTRRFVVTIKSFGKHVAKQELISANCAQVTTTKIVQLSNVACSEEDLVSDWTFSRVAWMGWHCISRGTFWLDQALRRRVEKPLGNKTWHGRRILIQFWREGHGKGCVRLHNLRLQ